MIEIIAIMWTWNLIGCFTELVKLQYKRYRNINASIEINQYNKKYFPLKIQRRMLSSPISVWVNIYVYGESQFRGEKYKRQGKYIVDNWYKGVILKGMLTRQHDLYYIMDKLQAVPLKFLRSIQLQLLILRWRLEFHLKKLIYEWILILRFLHVMHANGFGVKLN